MKEKIILIGGGGHCKSCIDVIEAQGRFQIMAIVDLKEMVGQYVLCYKIDAVDGGIPKLVKKYKHCLITIGQIKSAAKRVAFFKKLKIIGAKFPVIVSPHAYVSKHASIGEGSILMHGVIVNAGASIGKNCIINSGAIIEHDATVGDYCHISTGAVINGGVRIGERVFVGSNSVTKEYITIGNGSVIGAGLRVAGDLEINSFLKK